VTSIHRFEKYSSSPTSQATIATTGETTPATGRGSPTWVNCAELTPSQTPTAANPTAAARRMKGNGRTPLEWTWVTRDPDGLSPKSAPFS
jgi:hypothetical protein